MPLRYSCFISYRHSQSDIVNDLVNSLQIELGRWLDKEVYIDKERLKGGDFYNSELARALCESACMIVVYTPTYFSKEHSYCAREYAAMENLEEERLGLLGFPRNKQHGLIIPIVYRGDKKLPDSIKAIRQCYYFEPFQISGRANLKNPVYAQKIREIAEYIKDRFDELFVVEGDACSCCDTFEIPGDGEIADWLDSMSPPSPVLPSRVEA